MKSKHSNTKPGKPKPKARRHGPEPERLKLEGEWKANVDTALKVKRPAAGWPR
jgi:hypothetical protein